MRHVCWAGAESQCCCLGVSRVCVDALMVLIWLAALDKFKNMLLTAYRFKSNAQNGQLYARKISVFRGRRLFSRDKLYG